MGSRLSLVAIVLAGLVLLGCAKSEPAPSGAESAENLLKEAPAPAGEQPAAGSEMAPSRKAGPASAGP